MTKVVYNAKVIGNVDAAIASAHSSYADTKRKVQIAAVAVLLHAYNHGDYSKADVLINGLKGLNQRALVEYFVKFGGLTVDEEAGKFGGWKGKEFIKERFDSAKETMWYDLKVQNPWEGFDLMKEVTKLVERADKAREKAAKDPEKYGKIVSVDLAKLTALRQLKAA